MRVSNGTYAQPLAYTHAPVSGTLFVPMSTSTEEQVLFAALTSVHPTKDGNVPSNVLATVKRLMALYPENPAEGSPFGTGNETFGLSPAFKQASALIGDIMFQAPRRAWVQSATLQGVKVYSYLFNDRQAVPVGLPMLGGGYRSAQHALGCR